MLQLICTCVCVLGFVFSFAWALRLRHKYLTLRRREHVVSNSLPFRFCVCDINGKILDVHHEEEDCSMIRKVQDLPDIDDDIEIIFHLIREVMETGETKKRDLSGGNRTAVFKRLPNDAFGCPAVLWTSLDTASSVKLKADIEAVESDLIAITDAFAYGMILLGNDLKVVQINRYAENVTGYTERYAPGLEYSRVFSLRTGSENSSFETLLKEVRESGLAKIGLTGYNLVDRSGFIKNLNIDIHPVFGVNREIKNLLITFCDQTVIRNKNLQYLQNEKALNLALEMTDSAFFRYDPISRETSYSAEFPQLWPVIDGFPILEQNWVLPEDYAEFVKRRNELIEGKREVFEYNFRAGTFGQKRYFRLNAIMLPPELGSGKKCIFGIVQELTNIMNDKDISMEKIEYFRMLLDSIPCPAFIKDISNDFRYLFCNRAWFEYCGYAEKDVIGKNDFELNFGEIAVEIRKNDEKVNCEDKLMEFFERLQGCDGITRTFQSEKYPKTSTFGKRLLFGIAMDRTVQEAQNEEILRQMNFFHQLLDYLPASILVKDASTHSYCYANRMACNHVGLNASEIIGKDDFTANLYPGRAEYLRERDSELLEQGKKIHYNEELPLRNGNIMYYETYKGLIKSGDKRYIAILRSDISREQSLLLKQEKNIEELSKLIIGSDMVNACLRRVSLENDFDKAVSDMLLIIGSAMKADRCYIAVFKDNYTKMRISHQWCHANIEPRSLQEQKNYPEWIKILREKHYVLIEDFEKIPAEYQNAMLSNPLDKKFKTLLGMSITHDGIPIAAIGVDYVQAVTAINEEQIRKLEDAASIYLLAFLRKRQTEQLAENMTLQRKILDVIDMPLALINKDFTIAHFNAATARLTGHNLNSCLGKPCSKYFCMESLDKTDCSAAQTIQAKKPLVFERHLYGRTFMMHTMPIFSDGEVIQVLECFVDITDQAKNQKLLMKTAEDAQQAAQAKSLFLATMSHEIRTPLNAVIGFAELLKLGDMSESEHQEAIDGITVASNTLLQLINDILDLSKLESDRMKIVQEKNDLAALLADMRTIFEGKLKEKNLTGETVLPEDLPYLWFDAMRMRQVLLNLIGNALKFTHFGGICVTVSFEPFSANAGKLTIAIRDTGIGMDQDDLGGIFEPFTQAKSGRSASVQGTGLGLPICKRLIEESGGSIEVKSILGKGSCFTITLPQVRFEARPAKLLNSTPQTDNAIIGRIDMNVLLVDDVKMNLKVLGAMARKLGIKVFYASNGDDALDILSQEKIDAVLTDMWMPEMNGSELAAEIRKQPELNEVQIIAVSADAELQNTEQSRNFDGLLPKPVTLEKLYHILAKLPEKHAGE